VSNNILTGYVTEKFDISMDLFFVPRLVFVAVKGKYVFGTKKKLRESI
jgi:hypothetical protein